MGERWPRHWLSIARYADSNGLDENVAYGNAWRYRDWVVAAFNADLPYDAFIQKQLAVDLIEPKNKADLPALGFLGLGHKLYARSRLDVQAEGWAEQVDTVSQTFLGLTVACARCHYHKFDAITPQAYSSPYGMWSTHR